MTQGFQKVRNICKWMGTYMKIRWTPLEIHNISNIYNIICNTNSNNNHNNKNKNKEFYKLLGYKQKEWKHNLL
jgi:hypothetical protein